MRLWVGARVGGSRLPPSLPQVTFVASGALAARLPPFPLKCAENGDIDTPGYVAFDKLHFIL